MGCTVRDKNARTNRRARSLKPESDHSTAGNEDSNAGIVPGSYDKALPHGSIMPICNESEANALIDDNGWGYCTEEQLEELLMKNLDLLYDEAMNKLMGLGYDEEVALKAILRNGHCYGGMDVLTNILHNSLAYLNDGGCSGGGDGEEPDPEPEPEPEPSFSDLKQLEEYSLVGMVCLLRQVRPRLSKGDAMWCLLMSDLHIGRASVIEIPVLQSPGGDASGSSDGHESDDDDEEEDEEEEEDDDDDDDDDDTPADNVVNSQGVVSNVGVGVTPALCRFHGGWGFGNSGTSEFPPNGMSFMSSCSSEMQLNKEIECPKRFNLTPSMKNLLKRNVAMFAAGFRANSRQFHSQSQGSLKSLSSGNSSSGTEEESQCTKSVDAVSSVMGKFQDLNLDENLEPVSLDLDEKDEMILTLIHQMKDLEKQVKERKDWAHQKAMQAARKLSNDLNELKTLRMERDETQRVQKGKQALETTTMKRLAEMENALRIASGQVDRANTAVRKLELENAEIRAEMEASNLSASESVTTCLEAAKREKKCLKKLLAWEKQKSKMQDDIKAEKQKILDTQQELAQVEANIKDAEAKWRQEQKAKEQIITQLEEERRLKEAAEFDNKRKLESLRLKIEIDFQRYKDDLQRLEQEYARLKESAQSTELGNQARGPLTENSNGVTIAKLLQELDQFENSKEKAVSSDRECLICSKDEVSIVFLPCSHQVICADCNENYPKKGRATCPYCRAPIEKRIRVFGASS